MEYLVESIIELIKFPSWTQVLRFSSRRVSLLKAWFSPSKHKEISSGCPKPLVIAEVPAYFFYDSPVREMRKSSLKLHRIELLPPVSHKWHSGPFWMQPYSRKRKTTTWLEVFFWTFFFRVTEPRDVNVPGTLVLKSGYKSKFVADKRQYIVSSFRSIFRRGTNPFLYARDYLRF